MSALDPQIAAMLFDQIRQGADRSATCHACHDRRTRGFLVAPDGSCEVMDTGACRCPCHVLDTLLSAPLAHVPAADGLCLLCGQTPRGYCGHALAIVFSETADNLRDIGQHELADMVDRRSTIPRDELFDIAFHEYPVS